MGKIIACVFIILVIISCVRQDITTTDNQPIAAVTNTENCKFIKTVYFEARAQTLIYYLQLNTAKAGGNRYKILNISDETVMGTKILMVNIETYQCNK